LTFKRAAPLALALLSSVSTGLAAGLDISGNYGDERGCVFAKTQDYSEQDFVLLTSKDVSTAVTSCDFVQAVPHTNGNVIVTALCGHEGDGALTISLMRVEKDTEGADVYTVFDADGTPWGKVVPCQ
jgi:hypothetical protein